MNIKAPDQTEIKVPCMIFTRCVGYYSETNTWNKGKLSEFNDRKTYKIP